VGKTQVTNQEVLEFRRNIKRLYSKNYLGKDIAEKLGIKDTYLSSLVNPGKSGKRPGKAIVERVKTVFVEELKEIAAERQGRQKKSKFRSAEESEQDYFLEIEAQNKKLKTQDSKIKTLENRLAAVEKNTQKILALLEKGGGSRTDPSPAS
jgi:hypothetical protein